MRLKYYNFFIILPIFLVVAIIVTSFNYYIQKKELMLGLNEEIESISQSISIFVKHDLPVLDKPHLEKAFQSIISYGRVQQIILEKDEKIFIYKNEDTKVKENDNYKTIKELTLYKENDKIHYSYMATIDDKNLKLFVAIDATNIQEDLEKGINQSIIIVIFILLLGICVSYLLTYITSKNIKKLNSMAKDISNGNYNESKKEFLVKEVNDLRNTLNIVKNILKEMLLKTKNSILDNEFFNSDEYFLKLNKDRRVNSKVISTNNISSKIVLLDNNNKKEFYSCWNKNDTIYAFIGEVKGTEDINDYITASSITKLLKHYLNNSVFDINKINKMYKLKSLVVLEINTINNTIIENTIIDNNITKLADSSTLQTDGYYSFYHRDDDKGAVIQNYIEEYSHLEVEQLSDDLEKIFKDKGAVFIIHKEK